jgi:hypothetical protein
VRCAHPTVLSSTCPIENSSCERGKRWDERGERSERSERGERSKRDKQSERGERSQKSEKSERSERSERSEKSERSEGVYIASDVLLCTRESWGFSKSHHLRSLF